MIGKILKKIFILPVKFYQIAISPILGSSCRYEPTCSQYMIDAINEWGILKGGFMGMKRLASCAPWGSHGYDPVPKNGRKHVHEHSEEE